jgi:hypothetical protein
MNVFASTSALANSQFPSVRGIALVNGVEGMDAEDLKIAVEGVEENGTIVYPSTLSTRGLALVNGSGYIRGLALVNETPLTNDDAIVNGSTPDNNSISGTIMVFDATDVGIPASDISFSPISFITGTTAGKHWIVPGTFLSNNYELSYGLGSLTIEPADLLITAQNTSKTYGEPDDPPLFYDATGLLAQDLITGELNREEGEDVGEYAILQGSLSAGYDYLIHFTPGIFSITERTALVTLKIPFQYIHEGDPLPEFEFSYENLMPGDVVDESYTVFREGDGIAYDPASGESAGTYIVTPTPFHSNYTFDVETGILHVNPYGPGTRAVKPELNCVELVDFDRYIANMEYKNDNDAAVYIPAGEDNWFEATGLEWPDGQVLPTMFMPGGGSFYVYFDGAELTWILNSLDEDHKVSNAANANSSSTKCKNTKSAFVSSAMEEEELDPDLLMVYPNPVTDKVHLSMKDIEHYKMILILDITGKPHHMDSIEKRRDKLEIDMSQLSSGYYFIKIVMEDSMKVIQVIKD